LDLRGITWAGHVAYMRENKNCHKILSENLKVRDHLKDVGVDGDSNMYSSAN